MRHLLTILLFCLSQLSLSAQTRYVDLLHFDLIGKATTHTLTPYDRLPDTLQHRIRKPLWDLSRNTAGLSVRFRSNSTAISLKWENLNGFHMDHMTDIGVRGFDLYARQSDGTWHFAGVARVRSGKEGNSIIVKNMTPEWREYMLFLPLYDGVVKAAIGIDSTASIEKALVNDPITQQPIVFYGTSIMQGGCASRPGMAYTNILQRRLHRACVNLGFSGNDYMVVKTIELYYQLGQPEKGRELAVKFADELLASAAFYLEFYAFAQDEFELCGNYVYFLADVLKAAGEKELSSTVETRFSDMIGTATKN